MTVVNTDVLRVTAHLEFDGSGDDVVNVMHIGLLSPSSLPDSDVLDDIGELLEVYYGKVKALISSVVNFVDYTVQNVSSSDAPQTASWPTFTVGTATGDPLPSQVVALLLLRTNVSRKQGRVNLGGFVETFQVGGSIVAAALPDLEDFADELLIPQTMTNGNYSYGVQTVNVTPPISQSNGFDIPISRRVIANMRTQRRRTGGFGS